MDDEYGKVSKIQKNYAKTADRLTSLPKIALIFSEFDYSRINELEQKINELKNKKKTLFSFFRTKNKIPLTGKYSRAITLMVSIELVKSDLETYKLNRAKFEGSFDDLINIYEKLLKDGIKANESDILISSIKATINQLKLLKNTEESNINNLTNLINNLDVMKAEVNSEAKIFKNEAKSMSSEMIQDEILQDSDGIQKVVNYFTDYLSRVLALENRVIRNRDNSVSFADEAESMVDNPKSSDEENLSKLNTQNMSKVKDKLVKIFDDNLQKSIPVLPLLNYSVAIGQEILKVFQSKELEPEYQKKLLVKSLLIQQGICDKLVDYLDTFNNLAKQETENRLNHVSSLIDDFEVPNLGHSSDD